MKKAVIVYGPHSPFTKELLNACLKVKVKSLRHVRLFATPWTVAYQAPPSMGFSRQEYWSWVPLPSPKVSTVTPNYEIIKKGELSGDVQL